MVVCLLLIPVYILHVPYCQLNMDCLFVSDLFGLDLLIPPPAWQRQMLSLATTSVIWQRTAHLISLIGDFYNSTVI